MINKIRVLITMVFKAIFFRAYISIYNKLKLRNISDYQSNSNYQIKKLKYLIENTFYKIPYYKDFKFDLKEFSYSNFQNIPILTKEIIREKGGLLVNDSFKGKVYLNTSGGSTGEPVSIFRTATHSAHGMANYCLAMHLNGVSINNSSIDLWGAERDMHSTQNRFNLKSFLLNKTTLNTFVLSDAIIKRYIERMNAIKPKFIKAYVHSIYDISKFINRNNIDIDFKPVIHCTTGPLYLEMRLEIEKAFNQAHVYNFYGSREVSSIASEIKNKNGMYVLYDNVFIEILDDNDLPVKKGEEGQIVVTTLSNFYMPLVRYKIGDRAIKGDDLEFGTLKMERVIGRTLGVIHKTDGSKIDGQFFTTLFFKKNGIKNFQLIQKTISELQLNIVKTDKYEEKELDEIIERIETELPFTNVTVIFCDKIDLTATGKIMYVYTEIIE